MEASSDSVEPLFASAAFSDLGASSASALVRSCDFDLSQSVDVDLGTSTDFLDNYLDEAFDAQEASKIVALPSDRCEVLNLDRMQAVFRAEIEHVSAVMCIPPDECAVLLQAHRFDRDLLLQAYVRDEAHVRALVGLAGEPGDEPLGAVAAPPGAECAICGDDELEADDVVALRCAASHVFCKECFTQHVCVQVQQGKCLGLTCPGMDVSTLEKCMVVVPSVVVLRLLSEKERGDAPNKSESLVRRYQRFYNAAPAEGRKGVRACVNCDRFLWASERVGRAGLYRCVCKTPLCVTCGREAHVPVSCQRMGEWEKQLADDEGTAKWLEQNSKDCPKCGTPIEKNGGCNHMTCRVPSCRHEFCWLCFGDWRGHRSCNVENARPSAKRTGVRRQLFFFDRYRNHQRSKDLEGALRRRVRTAAREMLADQRLKQRDIAYLERAIDQLQEARRVLAFTYAYLYFEGGPASASTAVPLAEQQAGGSARQRRKAEKERQKLEKGKPARVKLFEFMQGELEESVEALSECLEQQELTYADRQKVVDRTFLCARKLESVLAFGDPDNDPLLRESERSSASSSSPSIYSKIFGSS